VRTITACRACGSTTLVEALNLGEHFLSDFREDQTKPPRVPLVVVRCHDCTLVQLRHTAPPADLYHPRYSFKSGVNPAIARDLADVVATALQWRPGPASWLDIASNDGTLLSHVGEYVWRVGCDPLEQFAAECKQHADWVVVDFFTPDRFARTVPFDIITSVSVFYDLDDPNQFVEGVKRVLADDGVWVVQQNYLLDMLNANSVDNVSHEHLAYYSVASLSALLARHGLEINDVQHSSVNGGCIRTVITRAGTREILPSVDEALDAEQAAGLDTLAPLAEFADRSEKALAELRDLIRTINERGQRVWAYGAGTRAGTIWQAAGLDHEDLPFVVDRNPDKVGRFQSAIGARIISEEQMRADPPDYLAIGPWWFKDQFVEREADFLDHGGQLIVPLPELEVIGR
jgi:SAM-dependent methyltransferase